MELRQLQYFLAAAKHLNFTKAARECCIVQSAMSQQITALEKEMGVRFFERTNRGLLLTAEGEAMAREARRLLDQAEIAQEIVRHSRSGYLRVLRVGCHGNLLRTALPRALRDFRERFPHTRVLMSTDLQPRLLDQLRKGQLDCLVSLRPDPLELDWAEIMPVCEEPIFAILPADHPLAAHETLRWADLTGQPVISFSGEERRRVPGGASYVYTRTTSQDCIETLVAAGFGISYCVGSAIREHPGLAYRIITDRPRTQTCLIWRKDSPSQEFCRELSSFLLMAASLFNAG